MLFFDALPAYLHIIHYILFILAAICAKSIDFSMLSDYNIDM